MKRGTNGFVALSYTTPLMTLSQRVLLLVYRVATRSGLLQLRGMRRIFETSYELYKRFMEAPSVALLKAQVS